MTKHNKNRIFKFLDAVSTNKMLQTIREETKPRVMSRTVDVVDQALVEAEVVTDEDEDAGDERVQRTYKTKKPMRQQSKTFKRLIDTFYKDEDLACNSDSACFIVVMTDSVRRGEWDYNDEKRLRVDLQKVYEIVRVLQPVVSTQRNYFVEMTHLFKIYFVKQKGETSKAGTTVSVVREILRAEKSEVLAYLAEKQQRQREKLTDKFHFNFEDVSQKTRSAYENATTSEDGVTTQDLARLLISLETACGSRKVELLDPTIRYYKYDSY